MRKEKQNNNLVGKGIKTMNNHYNKMKNAIISESETRDMQKLLDKIQENNATEKALADFRKLSKLDKYLECVHYGITITDTDTLTMNGWITVRIMEIYSRKFCFILLSGNVINCYELQ